jgi:hypothetical protein
MSIYFCKAAFEDFEIDISKHLSCFVAEITQKSGDHFRFFHRYTKLANQWISLQKLEPFQFVNPDEVTAE